MLYCYLAYKFNQVICIRPKKHILIMVMTLKAEPLNPESEPAPEAEETDPSRLAENGSALYSPRSSRDKSRQQARIRDSLR